MASEVTAGASIAESSFLMNRFNDIVRKILMSWLERVSRLAYVCKSKGEIGFSRTCGDMSEVGTIWDANDTKCV